MRTETQRLRGNTFGCNSVLILFHLVMCFYFQRRSNSNAEIENYLNVRYKKKINYPIIPTCFNCENHLNVILSLLRYDSFRASGNAQIAFQFESTFSVFCIILIIAHCVTGSISVALGQAELLQRFVGLQRREQHCNAHVISP